MGKRITGFLLLLLACMYVQAQQIPEHTVARNLKGEKIAWGKILQGEPVVLMFWSTTCKPCLSELAAWMELKERWQGKIRVIAVSIDDTRSIAKVKSIASGNKWAFEVYLDVNKDLYRALNLNLIPTSMLINNKGKVEYIHTGYMPGDELELLEKALKIIN